MTATGEPPDAPERSRYISTLVVSGHIEIPGGVRKAIIGV
jgi:hypothetical protein